MCSSSNKELMVTNSIWVIVRCLYTNSMFVVVYCCINIAGICHCLDTNTINNKELKLILKWYPYDKKNKNQKTSKQKK